MKKKENKFCLKKLYQENDEAEAKSYTYYNDGGLLPNDALLSDGTLLPGDGITLTFFPAMHSFMAMHSFTTSVS